MTDDCLQCDRLVRPKQEAFQCDTCLRWQHRTCGTGISRAVYRLTVRQMDGGLDTWNCGDCQQTIQPHLERIRTPVPTKAARKQFDRNDEVPRLNDAFVADASPAADRTYVISTEAPAEALSHDESTLGSKQDTHDVNRDPLDISFDLNDRKEGRELPLKSQSVGEPILKDTVLKKEAVEYEVVEQGSKRRGRLLVSTDGYSYTVKNATSLATNWRCSVRNKTVCCRATVIQRGDTFTRGMADHMHAPDNFIVQRVKVRAEVMRLAIADVHRSATNIVKSVMQDEIGDDLPHHSNIIRAANRARQQTRTKEHRDLKVDIAD